VTSYLEYLAWPSINKLLQVGDPHQNEKVLTNDSKRLLMKLHLVPMVDFESSLGNAVTIGAGFDLEGDVI
jgi:hypothetical protein